MNILIITPFYKQDKNIASVRWTNIAQRLAKKHNIFVVTQPCDDMDMTFSKSIEDGILVVRMNQKTTYEKIAVKYFGGATGDDWQTSDKTEKMSNKKEPFVRKAKNIALYYFMQTKAKSYAKEICKKVLPPREKIDIVISSACPFIEMLFGYEIKKRLGCKWISDFRDLPFTEDNCDDTHRMRRIMEKVLRKADGIFVVAPGMDSYLYDQKIVHNPNKIHIITNGFSSKDKRLPQKNMDTALHLCYTGSLYGGRRDPSALFKAIREVQKSYPNADFIIDYAGGNGQTLLRCAKKFGLEKSIIDHGFLPREKTLDLQSQSDCLLSLNFSNPVCTFNGKIYEYMLQDKPIIQIISGKYKNTALCQFINNLGLGVCFEEANEGVDFQKLCDYLIMQYQHKKNGISLYFEPKQSMIENYDHSYISQKVEQICTNIIFVNGEN